MRKILARLCGLIAAVVVVAMALVPVYTQERQIPASSAPIRDLIGPTDSVLTIVGPTYPPLGMVYPPDANLLKLLLDRHNLVVILRVDDRKTYLTPTANWLKTTVTGTIEKVFKADSSWSIRSGSRVSFVEEGGTIVLGHVTVHGIEYFRRPTAVGSRYLVFTEFLKEHGFVLLFKTTYELVGPGGLPKSLNSQGIETDDIERSYEADILARIAQYLTNTQ